MHFSIHRTVRTWHAIRWGERTKQWSLPWCCFSFCIILQSISFSSHQFNPAKNEFPAYKWWICPPTRDRGSLKPYIASRDAIKSHSLAQTESRAVEAKWNKNISLFSVNVWLPFNLIFFICQKDKNQCPSTRKTSERREHLPYKKKILKEVENGKRTPRP